jgi:hypothetical protein
MKIVKAETPIVEIPFQLRGSGVGITPTAWKSLEFALVRLEDEQGNVGWGEGFGYFTTTRPRRSSTGSFCPRLSARQSMTFRHGICRPSANSTCSVVTASLSSRYRE